jgi:hypothetical protein
MCVPAGTIILGDIKQAHNSVKSYQEILQEGHERAVSTPEEFYCMDTMLTDYWKCQILKFDTPTHDLFIMIL